MLRNMSTPQVSPRKRGRPSKLSLMSRGASHGDFLRARGRGRPRSRGRGRVRGHGRGLSSISHPITIDDDNDLPLNLGAQTTRWNDFKATRGFANNEETARFLMNSWGAMNMEKTYCIKLGKTTVRDFEMFQKRIQRSADEIIRFYMALGVEPGHSAIPVTEDVMKVFIMLKSSLQLSSTDLMKHLFEVYERYIKKSDQPSSIALEYSMRKAVREEMLRLVHEGVVPIMNNIQYVHGPDVQAESAAKKETPSVDSNISPETSKKRSRKSHPHRILVEDKNQPDPYHDLMRKSELRPVQDQGGNQPYTQLTDGLSVAVSSPEHIDLSDKDIMQYNYVIQSSTVEPSFSVEHPAVNGIPEISHDTHDSALHTQQGTITDRESLAKVSDLGTSVDSDCPRIIPEQQIGQTIPSRSTYEEATRIQIRSKKVSKGQRGGKVVKGTMHFCPHCDYKCVNPTRMKQHITLHTGKSFPCPMCQRRFAEENKLKKHIQAKHEKSLRFKCEVCVDRQFTSKAGLKYHFNHTHQNDFPYWCDQCCKGFREEIFYSSHMKKHTDGLPNQYECSFCSKEFSFLRALSMHRETCQKTVQSKKTDSLLCDICCSAFNLIKDLEEHVATEHCDETRFLCECGMEFCLNSAFKDHKVTCKDVNKAFEDCGMPTVHVENVEDSVPYSTHPDDTIKTEDKSRELNTSENPFELIQITNIESGEQFVYDLTQEDDSWEEERDLRHSSFERSKPSHVKVHSLTHKDKSYNCRYCQETFSNESKLTLHHSLKHKNKPPYCQGTYSKESKSTLHRGLKHKNNPPFKCDKCPRTFLSKGGRSYHQEAAHSNVYKFNCERCNIGFNKIKKFIAHKKGHAVTRHHVCEKCNLGFAYASLLVSHKRVCRGKIAEKNRNGLQLDLFPCKECPEKFAMLQGLKDHCLDVHRTVINEGGNQTKYLCECGIEFRLRALYDIHMRTCRVQDGDVRNISQPVFPS